LYLFPKSKGQKRKYDQISVYRLGVNMVQLFLSEKQKQEEESARFLENDLE